jgi:SAM-dependent methyltransferase
MVLAACVLHHVDPHERQTFVNEMSRVTRKQGLVAIAEHNPVNPFTRLVVARCAFDEGVVLVKRRSMTRYLRAAGVTPTDTPYILFLPCEMRGRRRLEQVLAPLPLGAQYIAAGLAP